MGVSRLPAHSFTTHSFFNNALFQGQWKRESVFFHLGTSFVVLSLSSGTQRNGRVSSALVCVYTDINYVKFSGVD